MAAPNQAALRGLFQVFGILSWGLPCSDVRWLGVADVTM
jgi:hypothetical protein